MNLQKMLKQAQQMQKQMENTQAELENMEFEGIAGGGLITVLVDGKNNFKSIKIKPEAVNPENPASVDTDTLEMLEDLIASAMKEAGNKASQAAQQKLSTITGGLNLNIPGLF